MPQIQQKAQHHTLCVSSDMLQDPCAVVQCVLKLLVSDPCECLQMCCLHHSLGMDHDQAAQSIISVKIVLLQHRHHQHQSLGGCLCNIQAQCMHVRGATSTLVRWPSWPRKWHDQHLQGALPCTVWWALSSNSEKTLQANHIGKNCAWHFLSQLEQRCVNLKVPRSHHKYVTL